MKINRWVLLACFVVSPAVMSEETQSVFQWRGVVPEAETSVDGWNVKLVQELDSTPTQELTFDNDGVEVRLIDSDSLDFTLYDNQDKQIAAFDYALEYVKVGIGTQPQVYSGDYFEIKANNLYVLKSQALLKPTRQNSTEPVKLAVTANENSRNKNIDVLLDGVIIRAAVVVTGSDSSNL